MKDLSAFIIPETLDEPEKILFFTYFELAILMFPLIIGIISDYTIKGLLAGGVCLFGYKKLKSSKTNYNVVHFIYWYCPKWLFKLNSLPSSDLRIFV